MAAVTFSINAVDKTRAAFASIRSGLNDVTASASGTQKKFNTMALNVAGVGSVAALLYGSLQRLSKGVEGVPGLDPKVAESFEQFRGTIAQGQNALDKFVGKVAYGYANLYEVLRYKAIEAFHGIGAAEADANEQAKEGLELMRRQNGYYDRLAKSAAALDAARKTLANINETDPQAIVRENQEAIAIGKQADATVDLIKKNDLLTESINLKIDAAKKMLALQQKDKEAMKSAADSETAVNQVWMNPTSTLKELNAERAKVLALMQTPSMADDPNATQRHIDLEQKLTDINKQRLSIMKEQKQFAMEVGATMASGFEDAIISGGKLSEVLKGLAQDLLRLVIRNTVTNNLAKLIGGAVSGIFSGGKSVSNGGTFGGSSFGADMPHNASGGPLNAGETSWVGEKGPELFTPSQAGRIIPNHQISGNGGGGNIYQIDARGADAGAVDRISQALIRLAGPGVVERRAISAVTNRRVRGGTLAAAL